MHKGYTLPYFINFFSEIPNSRWVCGEFGDTERKACALGHAGAYCEKLNENGVIVDDRATTPAREKALKHLIPNIIEVNDDAKTYKSLGKTPRARVLKALKLRQKLGRDWDENL